MKVSCPPAAVLAWLFQYAVFPHQLQIVRPGRGEDVNTLEAGRGAATVGCVRRMDTDIAGFHSEFLVTADVLLGAFKDDQNLLRRVTMDGKGRSRRLLDETAQDVLTCNEVSPTLSVSGTMGTSAMW